MDNKTYLGAIGEAKVIAHLTKERHHVFSQVTGKAPFDLIAYKDNKVYRISVKTIEKQNKYGSYTVQLKSVRSNRTGNTIINFDNNSCDILAIYILETDEVILLDSCNIKAKSGLVVKRKNPIERGTPS